MLRVGVARAAAAAAALVGSQQLALALTLAPPVRCESARVKVSPPTVATAVIVTPATSAVTTRTLATLGSRWISFAWDSMYGLLRWSLWAGSFALIGAADALWGRDSQELRQWLIWVRAHFSLTTLCLSRCCFSRTALITRSLSRSLSLSLALFRHRS